MPERARLASLLDGELDFHQEDSAYASHNLHSFPAKFPPQLPRACIEMLTQPGQAVLDPMLGSGTTIVESILMDRQAIGYDIDPLAILLCRAKSSPIHRPLVLDTCRQLVVQATHMLGRHRNALAQALDSRWDKATKRFLDYWFAGETQRELLALLLAIKEIQDPATRRFFMVCFSATIINRTGGVSLAIDLAHTRPHRAKLALDESGRVLHGSEADVTPSRPRRYQVKIQRPVFQEFERQVGRNVDATLEMDTVRSRPWVAFGNAQALPLSSQSIDLVVTSPPYAANAIDYMRTHKFSLVWLGYSIPELAAWRKRYIGATNRAVPTGRPMPARVTDIINRVSARDSSTGRALHRYYGEMSQVLREVHRVLKPGSAAIMIVGNSILRGVHTETAACLCELGEEVGFEAPIVAVRQLDRDRRMMPASRDSAANRTGILERMHEESVIGFRKPDLN